MKNKKPLIFRSFKKKDVKEVLILLNSLSKKNKEFFHPHAFDEKTLLKNLNSDDHYFVLTLDEKIIGYSFLRFFGYEIPSFGCCIRKGFENNGFGTIITDFTIKKARELGYNKIILKTYRENTFAQKIYNKLGFKITSETDDKRQYKMELEI
jgi:RimJ/RimL family protein N-acetyltransferase